MDTGWRIKMSLTRKPKKYENVFTKAIAVILLIAMCLGLLYCGYLGIKMYDAGVFDDSGSYYKSDQGIRDASRLAYDIQDYYISDPNTLNGINYKANYSYAVYEAEGNDYVKVLESPSEADDLVTYVFFYYYINEDANMPTEHLDSFHTAMPKQRNSKDLKIEIRFYDPPIYDDEIKTSYNDYVSYKNQVVTVIAVAVGLIIGIIMDLLFILSSAGYDNSYDGLILNVFDRMPYDMFTAVCAGLCGLVIYAGGDLDNLPYMDPLSIAVIVGILLVLGIVVLFWMVSTAKRIKKGGLLKNTISYAVISYICQIFLGLRIVWKFIVLLVIYLFIMMFSIDEQEYIPLAIRTVVVCAYMLWWLVKADEIKVKTAKTAKGDLNAEIETNLMPNSLKQHAENINSIQDGIRLAVEREMKSEHLKTELITNVSHDIKTPLTSIINYVDLLQKEHTDEEETQYLEVLARQSDRLKKLIEDLIEASKASTGNINVELTKINVNEILNQSLSEYQEKLQEKELDVIVTTPENGCYVMADGNLFWRILNNLYNNIYKYALPNTRVYIDVDKVEDDVRISIKNISKEKLNISSEELMERFVRGDFSRHTEGSGLGLNIARSLADIQHGSLDLFIDGDLFKIELRLPEA